MQKWLLILLCLPGAVLASPSLSQAISKFENLASLMQARDYRLTLTVASGDETDTLVIAQQANRDAELVAENGEPPSAEALQEFDSQSLYGGGGGGFKLALPSDGYQLIERQGDIERYQFQPLLLNKGEPDRAGRFMSGELTLDTSCQCLLSLSMANTDSFRKLGFKIENIAESWTFAGDDWRPTMQQTEFAGGALVFSVAATTTMAWQYP